MDTATRLRINAMIDTLVSDESTFPAATAADLIRLLPLSRKSSMLQVEAQWSGDNSSARGVTASGPSSIDSTEDREIRIGADNRDRIGGYRIEHSPGRIDIALMWDDIGPERKPTARLEYDRRTRSPIRMLLSKDYHFRFGMAKLTYWRKFNLWKLPAERT
ncbi:hypothetical protein SAMN02745172_02439 [Pseudoxanthobacter soli DSM 19599]|uniref:Uncharacterized protein n=1 Tax=Pseudoxanthobacter soli DSM 19599 TaxID=1123029 RepID=A0A1M7ZLW2_9HYPH|nr:hypothetical protein [Pseudoxanthobacter soli]SHO65792.1 hypothetical protein SAMN02745172_02439 [Pseudoxanthobacter soli DSM 19599]